GSPRSRRFDSLHSALFAGFQPDREFLLEAQGLSAQGAGADQIRLGRRHRRMLRNADAQGMREFLPTLRIWSRVTGNRSNQRRKILNVLAFVGYERLWWS